MSDLNAATQNKAKYEVRLSNVPDGAYTADYLGGDRYFSSKRAAEKCVARFNRAKKADPESFEPEMVAEVVEL